jgi:hypothetical protein
VGRVLLRVGLSLLLVAAWFALGLAVARRNLEALGRVDPLSWEAVRLAWCFALYVALSVLLLLVALAVLLWPDPRRLWEEG